VLQPETRALWNELLAQGWTDGARHLYPHERKSLYTFYVNDFAFRREAGFRMDFHLLSPSLVSRLVESVVDAEYRGREKPSDHAPVWIELADS
jgi:exodeoxyribonuclease III